MPKSFVRKAAIAVVVCGAFVTAAVFAAGAVAAEGALHPHRVEIARVCPCFSHMSCTGAAVTAPDGIPLSAWFYTPDRPNGSTVILLHGIGASRQDMLGLGYFFLARGYDVLMPDLRGHGESGGFTTYGIREAGDISAWVDWLTSHGHAKIYGFGASLGASVLLESLRHETRFRAVIAESAYSDFPSVARERIARTLPVAARWIAPPLVASGLAWTKWREHVDLASASPVDGIRATVVPVLLIHGLSDDKTSPDNSRRLAAANPSATLWLVPGSGHTEAWKTAKAEFESRVTGWFSSH